MFGEYAERHEITPLIAEHAATNSPSSSKSSRLQLARNVLIFALIFALSVVTGRRISFTGTTKLLKSREPAENEEMISIILTADNGDMVGTSESGQIKALMTDLHGEEYDQERLFCQEALHGYLFGQNTMIITTGIGHDRAALCLRSILAHYHKSTKEILFLGTGGFSPARGGILNSDECDSASPAVRTEIVPLGSVCVSPLTTNWDCHKCVWPSSVHSACAPPPCTLHDRADLFGDWGCSYYTTPSLADEVLDASNDLALPLPSSTLRALEAKYWQKMANGTGESYQVGTLQPKVLPYTVCAETTSNTFWVGTPYDELGRDYVALVINSALESDLYLDNPPALSLAARATKRDTVCVSAMEGTGWMEVLALEEVYLKYDKIPAVNIRGAADFVHPPLMRRPDGTWREDSAFVEDLAGDVMTVQGYDLAIQTTSAIVINLFRVRAMKNGAGQRKTSNK
mmetsp:Transcript_59942/g.135588  ORF Transcript_59942/g.135588 Transcript_59942/m.135588 type:complete len:458 (-) Transcript_59942:199-1572(-)